MRIRALAAAMIAAILALGTYSMPVSAAPAKQQQQPSLSANGWTQHDTSHPVKVNYPCPGMSLHGQGNPQFSCVGKGAASGNLSGKDVEPGYVNVNPATYCKNGIAYLQSRNGDHVWYSWVAGSSGSNIESWVEYFWCPTSSGPYASINWAYGNTYTDTGTSPNCDTIGVGIPSNDPPYYNTLPPANTWYQKETGNLAAFAGAALIQSGTGTLTVDTSSYNQWSQCPGSGNIYSYSNAANGAYAYEPHMYGFNSTRWSWSDANWGWGQYQ